MKPTVTPLKRHSTVMAPIVPTFMQGLTLVHFSAQPEPLGFSSNEIDTWSTQFRYISQFACENSPYLCTGTRARPRKTRKLLRRSECALWRAVATF